MTEIRVKEHLGITTSETTTDQFTFFVTPLTNKMGVGKGDYVILDHPVFGKLCPLLAVVKEMRNYEEVVGTTLGEHKSIKIMAVGEIRGYVDLGHPNTRPLRQLTVPPNPGSKVYLPYFEFLEDVFKRRLDGTHFTHPLHIGQLQSQAYFRDHSQSDQLNFYLDADNFMKQHFLISGITGTGKTHTAIVLVEELANKASYPIVILDPYGEYTTINIAGTRFNEAVQDKRILPTEYPFDFHVSIYACNPERVKDDLKKKQRVLGNTVSLVPISNWRSKTRPAVKKQNELMKLVKPKQVILLDSRGVSQEERLRFYTFWIKALWNGRINQSISPVTLIIEDPLVVDAKSLEKIATEGRKLGFMMCLLSQHPTELNRKILSQITTHFVGQTTEAGDLEYFQKMSVESGALVNLRRGEWIVRGMTQKRPTKIVVRERYSHSQS